MNDDPSNTAPNQDETPPEKEAAIGPEPWYRRWFRRRTTLLALPALAFGGLFAGQALAERGFAPGHGHGWRGHRRLSDEQLVEHLRERIDFVLDRLDANDEQKVAIRARLELLEPELLALRNEHVRLHEELGRELGKPTLDPAKVEAARAALLASGDRFSKALTDALLDVSDVLTLEQRQRIVEHWQRHR
ncbi:MAG: periplasmic heavy metal sensor [Pseudomonadota bacterium]|nr:MAG: hypothetical protein DIU78_24115 [Pseudomonadota bacterium]